MNKDIIIVFVITIYAILLQIYYSLAEPLYEVPYYLKCFFKENKCEEGNIDIWSIIYGLIYFVLGLIVPDRFFLVFTVAILFEIFQASTEQGARFIINPLIAITGYAIGSLLSPQKKKYLKKYNILE
jgi:hypothetical protein